MTNILKHSQKQTPEVFCKKQLENVFRSERYLKETPAQVFPVNIAKF